MGREQMRAGDDDRRQTADALKRALDEGRLDLSEYDERLQQTYAAKTYGELDAVLADLPGSVPAQPAVPVQPAVQPARRGATAEWVVQVWSSWAFAVSITTVIWAVSCLANAEWQYFWPIWVAGPWGIVLLFTTIGGISSGAPRKMVEARERKAGAKQRKRERRALKREAARAALPSSPGEKWQMSDSKVADTPEHG